MYIVAYDISETKERNKVIKVLNNYGERVQESVWTCELDTFQYSELRKKLEKLQLKSGFISIWQARSTPWKTGDETLAPVRPWSYCF